MLFQILKSEIKTKMESFSKTSKLELISQDAPLLPSFFFGLFLASGSYNEFGEIEISTDIKEIFEYLQKNLKKTIKKYEINSNFDEILEEKENFVINGKTFYKITFKNNILEKVFNLLNINQEDTIEENILKATKTVDNIKNFTKGMFIGCATSSIKISEKANEKTSSGYHLEFSSKSLPLLREFSHVLAQFDISPKLITRKNIFVLYLKDAEQVCNLLALVGANNSVLILQNEIAKRDFRNKINRQTNCLSGNISKTVDASLKQLEAIKKIDNKIGLDKLPPDLEEVALLRLANPEEPLNILLQLSNIQLTKSGLNHRFRKIISMAEKL